MYLVDFEMVANAKKTGCCAIVKPDHDQYIGKVRFG